MKRMVAYDDTDPGQVADVTRYIGLDGEWREVDLTRDNEAVYFALITQLWKLGRKVSEVPKSARASRTAYESAEPERHPGQGPGGWASSRKYWDEFRAWCDANGRTYRVKSGFNAKQGDIDDFEAFRAQAGEADEQAS